MREQIALALLDAIESIKNSDMLSGAALLGVAGSAIAVIWANWKKWMNFVGSRIRRLMMFRVTLEYFDDMYWYLEEWMHENASYKYRNVIAYLDGNILASGKTETYSEGASVTTSSSVKRPPRKVIYKHHSDFVIVKHNGRRMFIRKDREKNASATTLQSLFYDSFYIFH